MTTSTRNYLTAAAGASLLVFIVMKSTRSAAPEPQREKPAADTSARTEAAAQSVEILAQSAPAPVPAVTEARPADTGAPAPAAANVALPRTRDAFLALADSEEIPAPEKRRLFFATAASPDVPDEVRRSGLMLGLRRIDPAVWPEMAGKLLLDEAQPAWIHDALMQDLHARGHEFSLPWFEKVAASPSHALKKAATEAATTYRRLAGEMSEEVRRATAASAGTPD